MTSPHETLLRAQELLSEPEYLVFHRAIHHLQEKALPLQRSADMVSILFEIFPDAETALAMLLLESEDEISDEEIKNEYGIEVVKLLHKLREVSLEKMFSVFPKKKLLKQIILSFITDIRVLFFLIAERMHFLKNLQEVPQEMRLIVAQEALEILAPLALRIGIHRFSTEFEDLGFSILYPHDAEEIKSQMKELYSGKEKDFLPFQEKIQECLKKKGIEAKITGRTKSIYSVFKKLNAKGRSHIADLQDILAVRIITKKRDDAYIALGCVHGCGVPVAGRIKDYIAGPKRNGYQSLHTTILVKGDHGGGSPLEVQIRDEEMDHNAEWGMASHILYRKKKSSNFHISRSRLQKYMTMLAQNFRSPEFLKEVLEDIFESDIFVFTPSGEVRHFPPESTLLDFAYAVHSDIGDHCSGGIVNEKPCSIHTVLHTGDRIEITSTPSITPQEEWLSFVQTPLARNRIRAFLKLNRRNGNAS